MATDNHTAAAKGTNLNISTKHCVEICNVLRFKPLALGKIFLEDVIAMRKPVPFRRFNKDTGHKKGPIAAGRYPIKASKHILAILKSVESNAQAKGLNASNLKVTKLVANKASIPMGGGRNRQGTKRTHVEIEVMEYAKKKTDKKSKPAKAKTESQSKEKKEEPKAEEKSTPEVKEETKPTEEAKEESTPETPTEEPVESPKEKEKSEEEPKEKIEEAPKTEQEPAKEESQSEEPKTEETTEEPEAPKEESTPEPVEEPKAEESKPEEKVEEPAPEPVVESPKEESTPTESPKEEVQEAKMTAEPTPVILEQTPVEDLSPADLLAQAQANAAELNKKEEKDKETQEVENLYEQLQKKGSLRDTK